MDDLVKKLNFSLLPYKIIKNNAKLLSNLLKNIKDIKIIFSNNFIKHDKNHIDNILKKSLSYTQPVIRNIIDNQIINIYEIKQDNIKFYYVDTGDYYKDIKLFDKLFKITLLLTKLVNSKQNIICIWIPTDKKRIFNYNKKFSLEKNINISANNYNAFSSSGVSWKDNDINYSLITRYEEIEKLLLHELIHNLNIDGSKNNYNDLLIEYKKIKPTNNYHYDHSMYETYAELLATYLYIVFSKYFNNKINIKAWIIIQIIYSYNIIVNLIKLNHKTLNDFKNNLSFKGDICIYEYYFLKTLAYHIDLSKFNIFKDQYQIYKDIICLKPNNLLDHFYDKVYVTNNLSYIYEIK